MEEVIFISPLQIALLSFGILVGISFIIFSFCVIRRLHELHKSRQKIEGELHVSNSGDIFSEFGIPIEEILKRDTILLKVVPIKSTSKEEKEYANIPAETHKA